MWRKTVKQVAEKRRMPGINDRGFTLIETMVVVGILLLFGLMTTSFNANSWFGNYRLRGAARDLSSAMQKARMGAIKDNLNWSILFDTTAGTYQLQSWQETPVAQWNNVGSAVTMSTYKSGVGFGFGTANKDISNGALPAGPVTAPAEGTKFRLQYTSTGMSVANGAGWCYLANSSGAAYAVGAMQSGSVRIKKWSVNTWVQ